VAAASLPGEGNTDVVVLRITVHPEYRGRGAGTELLRHVATEGRARGRSTVEVRNLPAGLIGAGWARRRGFALANTTVDQQLDLRAVDPASWSVEVPAGYHLVTWSGATPEDLLASFAKARNAIRDAPAGVAAYNNPQWTDESVRAEEARLVAIETTRWTVVAVRDADNEVAGFTQLMLRSWFPDLAIVGDTAVLEQHRGHGLGVLVKARMSAWLHADEPARKRVVTSTAADNEHMLRVNERIGFRTVQTTLVLNAELDALTGRQSAQQNLEQ
jgi:GNAT superfamily N-acetyltransferase